MLEVLTGLFDPAGFARRGEGGTGWTPALIWLHATSDFLIWLAYVSIPLMLFYFTRRRDLPFPRLFVLFALFLLACGTTHLIDALLFEYPVYRFEGVMKAVTAVLSWTAVVALIQVIPRVVPTVTGAVTATDTGTKHHRPLSGAGRGVPWRAYIIAVLVGVLALLVRGVVDTLLRDDQIFVVALLGVVYVSWQHGFRPALVTLIITVVGYMYFFLPPRGTLFITGLGNQLASALFFFCGVACAALGESQRVAQRRARAALTSALARQEELESEVVRRRVVEAALRQREGELMTARNQAAEALARLDAFLDNAPVGIVFFDHDLRYEKVNTFLAAANGKPVSEHLGRKLTDVLPDFPRELAETYRRIATGASGAYSGTVQRPNLATGGALVWHVTAFPVRRADGYTLGAGVVLHDITEQRRTADELAERARATALRADVSSALATVRETNAALQTCVETLVRSLDAALARIWLTDATGEWLELRASAGLYTHLDGAHSRVRVGDFKIGRIAQTGASHLTNDVLNDPNVSDPAWAAREGMRSFVGYPLVVEGRVLGVLALFSRAKLSEALVADLGPVAASVAQYIDRRRTGGALHESEERFRTMADSSPALIWLSEPDRRRTYFNKTWLAFTGRTPDQLAGFGWADDIHPEDRARYLDIYNAAADRREPFGLEYRLRRHDGEYRWVLARGTPRHTSGGTFVGFAGLCLDVTDQRAAEIAVRLNEERYRTLTEAVPHIVWNAGADGEITYFNRRWLEQTALQVEEARGGGWMRAVHPDDRDRVYGAWQRTVNHATSGGADRFSEEFRLMHTGTGTYRWFQSVAVPLRHADGRVDQWIGSMADIHDQKTAVELIGESEAFRRSVFENSPDCLKVFDLDGRVLEMNQAGCRLMEVDDFEAIRGGAWAEQWPVANRETIREAVADARAGAVGRFQGFCPTAKGTPRYWDVSVAPLPGADGRPFRLLGVSRDVTEQRRAEEHMRASELRFRTLTETVPQIVWTADPRGTVTFFNRRWAEYTGAELESGRESGWGGDLLHPDDADRLRAGWQLAVANRADGFSQEFRLRRAADGEYRWFLSAAISLRDPTGAVGEWVGTLTDIDDQKRQRDFLEQVVRERTAALEQANAALTGEIEVRKGTEAKVRAVAVELERSNGELEKFAYIASHDLQEPLRKIQAFGDRLVTKCRDALPDKGKEYVDRMLVAAGRMRRLIDDLLSFSRVTTQQRPFKPLDLGKLVREVVSDLDVRIGQANGRVVIGALPEVRADPTQMRQLFQNLIANAVKFQRPGVPPVVEIAGELVTPPPGDPGAGGPAHRLSVRDNGIGFDEKYRDRIFEVFQRLHGRDEYEGTGVGLAICRKIAERHGGTITAHSREGDGATFVVTLPVRQTPAHEDTNADAPQEQANHDPDGR
ncbi:PAS domain S-box protein [Gemmata sp. G18]|uniref:histidine kinase n=1 Tax=Gemmata palustris TaxID=2822762 RepID=A0ABS5BQH9_9BACT|nr:PAS domain S-box protein [Gemmata palustris]MBP3955989.1 PAS domain S-box protein [Gemmata palustris]